LTTDDKKRAAARAALALVRPAMTLGVGTGTTANHFIDVLAAERPDCTAVASSNATAGRLIARGIRVLDLNELDELELYVDGADEANPRRELIKGGGGALTREKILAAAARRFACIVDDSKLVESLGAYPLPVEVIPMACAYVIREVARLGGRAVLRAGVATDNGHALLEIHGFGRIAEPAGLESRLDGIAGVVANGLFARRPADLLIVGTDGGIQRV
jgi:ribose 5-phosphate isomerase A